MATKPRMPTYLDLLWPTLKALEDSGGSASIHELSSLVSTRLSLPDDILNELHSNGPQTEVDYRAAWARTHLKFIEAIENPSRGVWTITKTGRSIESARHTLDLVKEDRKERFGAKAEKSDPGLESNEIGSDDSQDWENDLLKILQKIKPDAFERLCQRVLREEGFTRVEVTGRAGDGGIDGAGVLRVRLISFHVMFQCKRYKGPVGAPAIRDFRGAMVGRADKGLFITTGVFTKDAQHEAVRDGAPAIDLVNGSELCELLKNHNLGVSTKTVQVVTPNAEFFDDI